MTAEEQAAKDAADKTTKANEEQAAANAKQAKINEEKIAQQQCEQAAATAKLPISIVGRLGGAFNIDGAGFGATVGTLTIGGQVIHVSAWRDDRIKGQLPATASGAVVLTTETGVRHGVFPNAPQPVSAPIVASEVKK